MKKFKEYLTESYEPPMVLVLKRKGIRNYPQGQRVALYHSDVLGMDFSIPYYANGPQPDLTGHAQMSEETIQEDYGRAAKVGMGFPKDTMHHVRIGQDMEYYHSKTAYRHHGTLVHKDHRGYHVKDQATGETHKFRYWDRKRYEKDTAKLHPKRVDETIQESAMHRITKIHDEGKEDLVVFKNGGSARIHPNTAKSILDLHSKVNGTNKKKIAELINTSPAGLEKVAKFAMEVKEG